jgi:ParB family chromosome partitioning protein
MMNIQIKDLRFGHDEGAPAGIVNVRSTNRDVGLEGLAASIAAHGLIQPLAAIPGDDGAWFVIDGNRRLAAIRRLTSTGQMAETDTVPVIPCEGLNAREIGLAANTIRAPLHEADQYEAFTALVDAGLDEAAIAGRFGIEAHRVRRILALGRLSPKVLNAWREGALGREATGCVRAFTLAPSIKEQERVLAKLTKQSALYPHTIRSEFGAARGDAGKHLAFVGRAAYEAAGGRMIEDLFGTDHVISDPAIAKQLADEKLAAECARLVEQGWSWAAVATDLPDGARWSWATVPPKPLKPAKGEAARLKALAEIIEAGDASPEAAAALAEHDAIRAAQEARRYDEEARAKSGCVLNIGHRGDLEVRLGVIKPSAAKAEKKGKAAGPDERATPTISAALVHRLSVQMTLGVQAAIKASPHAGLAALVAGAICGGHPGQPVRLRLEGFSQGASANGSEKFEDVLERLLAMSTEDLVAAAAQVAARAIDLQAHHPDHAPARNAGVAALAGAINSDLLATELAGTFDPADYFASASKPIVIRAIEEAVNSDEARKAGSMKKADLVAFAVANVAGKGWLPPEIRHPGYAGPGASA